jgi:exosortase/archaeosortase family protein
MTETSASNARRNVTIVSSNRSFLLFLIKFVLLFLIFEWCYQNDFFEKMLFERINIVFASLGATILNMFGIQVTQHFQDIQSPLFMMSVRKGCDGMEPIAIFCSAILAHRAPIKMKAYGLVLGIVIIVLFNIIRIVNLFWVGAYHSEWFDTLHMEFWQIVFIGLAVILYYAWRKWADHVPISSHS